MKLACPNIIPVNFYYLIKRVCTTYILSYCFSLLRNQEETYQRVWRHELHISELQPLREGSLRHGQKVRENHFLLSQGDLLLWEESSRKRVAAMAMERKLKELRKESDHNRQMLAKVKSNFQPFQGALVPLLLYPQSTEARRCQGIPWVIRPPGKEEGHAMRAQEPGVTCRFDSAHSSCDTDNQDTTSACVFPFWSNFIFLFIFSYYNLIDYSLSGR